MTHSNVGTAGAGNLDSAFQLSLLAGTYYVGIGVNNTSGLDAALATIVSNNSGVLNPNGVLAAWSHDIGFGGPGTYQILISQQMVPEPSSLAIASCGLISLLAVGVRRWRRLT